MYFGEVSILANIKRTATVSARGYCTIGRVQKKFFKELMIEYPKIKMRMLNQMEFY
jgi:CRP-like cAMP-binding protein